MDTKGICILVVNDDLTCNNIVSEMLQHCNYQVLHVGSVLDVLNAIWETKDNLDLVLTNAHKLESNGMVILQHIQKKLNLPVILMCADKTKILSKGQPFSFAAYVLNGLSRGDVNNLWQFALEKERDKMVAACQEQNVQKASMNSNIAIETNYKTCASTSEAAAWFNQKRKRKDPLKEKRKDGEDDLPIAKKTRVVWTSEMHQKFLEAIETIGYEKAVPKKIVEVMGIPGLTRENVASHLQKFRCSTKRTQDVAKESISTAKSHYLKTHNEISFGTTSERNIGGYVHELQLTPNFRIYGDQTRNTVLQIGKNIPCGDYDNRYKSGKFVGYRLTKNGNSIEFGNLEASNNDNISRETQVYVQGDANKEKCLFVHDEDISIQSTTEEPGNYFPVQDSVAFSEMAQSFDDFLDEDMLNGTGNKCCSQLDWEEFDDVLFEHDDN